MDSQASARGRLRVKRVFFNNNGEHFLMRLNPGDKNGKESTSLRQASN